MSCDLGQRRQTPPVFWFVQQAREFFCRSPYVETRCKNGEMSNCVGQGGLTAVPRRGRERPRFGSLALDPNLPARVAARAEVAPAHAFFLNQKNSRASARRKGE